MKLIAWEQLSLIAECEEEESIGDWGWEIDRDEKLGTNSDEWKPPIGCLQKKWIKTDWYWYWRYYDNRGKKRSLYLAKDYNKAIRKAQKIGVPTDAKISKTDPQIDTTDSPTAKNPSRYSGN